METSETRPLMPGELARLMGCSRPVIDAALKAGRIPHTRLGRRIFIPRAVALALLNGEPLNRNNRGAANVPL
jgi:excisionase family DNA binding protein